MLEYSNKKIGLVNRILSLLEDEKVVLKEDIIFYFNKDYDRNTVSTSITYAIQKKYLINISNIKSVKSVKSVKPIKYVKISDTGLKKISKNYKSPWFCPKQEKINKLSVQFYRSLNVKPCSKEQISKKVG